MINGNLVNVFDVGETNICANKAQADTFFSYLERVKNNQSVLLMSDPNTGKSVAALQAAYHYALKGDVVIFAPNRNAVSHQIYANAVKLSFDDDKEVIRSCGRVLDWYSDLYEISDNDKQRLLNRTYARFDNYTLSASMVNQDGCVIISSVDAMVTLTESLKARGINPVLIIDEYQESYEMGVRHVYSKLHDSGVSFLAMSGTIDTEAVYDLDRFYQVQVKSAKAQATIDYTLMYGSLSLEDKVRMIMHSIAHKRKIIFFENNRNTCNALAQKLAIHGIRSALVMSEQKQFVSVEDTTDKIKHDTKRFLDSGQLGEIDCVIGTSSLVAGLNVEDIARFDVYAVMSKTFSDHHCKQLEKRIRKSYSAETGDNSECDVNVHLLAGVKKATARFICDRLTTESFYKKSDEYIKRYKTIADQAVSGVNDELEKRNILRKFTAKKLGDLIDLDFDFFNHINDFSTISCYNDTVKKLSYRLYTTYIANSQYEFAAKVSGSEIDCFGFVEERFKVEDLDNPTKGKSERLKLYKQGEQDAEKEFIKLSQKAGGQELLQLLQCKIEESSSLTTHESITVESNYELGFQDKTNKMIALSSALRMKGNYNMSLIANCVANGDDHYALSSGFIDEIDTIKNLRLSRSAKVLHMNRTSQLTPVFAAVETMLEEINTQGIDLAELEINSADELKSMIDYVFQTAHDICDTIFESGVYKSTYAKKYESGVYDLTGTLKSRKALIDIFLEFKRVRTRHADGSDNVYIVETTTAFKQMKDAFDHTYNAKPKLLDFARISKKPVKGKFSVIAPQITDPNEIKAVEQMLKVAGVTF